MKLLRRLLGQRRQAPRPAEPERLQRIYHETHRQVERLRRAA
jgi:hypothetical protein